jgi:hypothetical protein
MSDTRWRQLDDSVETALRSHPTLTEVTICLPQDLPDPKGTSRQSGRAIKSARDKWDEHAAKWRRRAAQQHPLSVTFWGTEELFEREC